MDEKTISVTLTGPAKINGVREPTGKTVTVSPTLALQLAASGVINPQLAEQLSNALDMSDTVLESDFQKAVEDAAAGRIDVLKEQHGLEIQKIIAAAAGTEAGLEGRLKEAVARAEAAEKTVTDLTADLAAEVKARTAAEKKAEGLQAKLAKTQK